MPLFHVFPGKAHFRLYDRTEFGIIRNREEMRAMRVLAILAFSFAGGTLIAAYFLPLSLLLPLAGGFFLLAVLTAVLGDKVFSRKNLKKVLLLVLGALTASQLWFYGYTMLMKAPVTALCGQTQPFTATVCDYPQPCASGWRVTVRLTEFHGAKANYYGDETLSTLVPGNELSGTAYWQDAAHLNEDDVTTFTARGVYALLYSQNDLQISEGAPDSVVYLPQRAAKALKEKITAIYGENTLYTGFLQAELTGDRSALPEDDYASLTEAGLAHLFAVSGLHCAFLVSLLGYLLPTNRRRLGAAISIVVLLFYMCLTGLTPSVVRACVMQIFILLAPLLRRSSDGLTSLGAALWLILLCNPYAIGSVSLQLSFSATFGLVWLSPKLMRAVANAGEKWPRWGKKCLHFVLATLCVSVSVLAFTVPISAYYFNSLCLIAPLSNLLAVWAAGLNFMWGFFTVLVGFIFLPAAQVLGYVCRALILYVQWVVGLLTRIPYHNIYFTNRFLRSWLILCYAMFGLCYWTKDGRRKWAVASVLAVMTLVFSVWLNTHQERTGTLNVLTLNVGQGESVLLYSGAEAALVDCGSGNSTVDAGDVARQMLQTLDYPSLSYLAVTHYHADHTNGIRELLRSVKVEHLLLADVPDDKGTRAELESLAGGYDIPITYITDETTYPLGGATLTLYPPLTVGDTNEAGLSALCTTGSFDALITGDMSGDTEELLTRTYTLPDIEVLLVSHHGSRYSSQADFLAAVKPEEAIISVGHNNYGHPNTAALLRLEQAGANTYRTDMQGNIRITVNGGDGK
jgi:competence protein ComEC